MSGPHPDPRTPVLVGVGTAQRGVGDAPVGAADLEPIELMVEATKHALADAGVAGSARRIGWIAVPVGNWAYADPGRLIAQRIGATDARTARVEVGVPQQSPVQEAARRIRRGELEAAVVVGGETLATRQRLTRSGAEPVELDQGEVDPDERWTPQGEIMTQAEIDAGMWSPVEQYACIDNALAHAEGCTPAEHLDEIAELWHRFNEVAVANPDAAFATPRSREFLRSAGPGNRPLAHPYAKWHSTQWSVDQAAALVLCSAALADELVVPRDRWVFPHLLAESSHSLSLSRRDDLHRWPAMQVLGRAAADRLGTPLSQIPHVELYSCFPSAVRVQQRELGLDLGGTPTVTGGMAFAGGPFNNFTYQSTAAIVGRLRDDPGSLGMTTTVSGLLTKPAIAVWSTRPAPEGEWVADLAEAADAATASRPSTAHHEGEGTVATWTVTYDGDAARSAFVIADLDDGRRWVGTSTDGSLIERALRDGVIGDRVRIDDTRCRPA